MPRSTITRAIAAATAVICWTAAPALGAERTYELVSPPDTNGFDVVVPSGRTDAYGPRHPATADGGAVLYGGSAALPGFDGNSYNDAYRARRKDDRWATEYVGAPSASDLLTTTTYGWSADLSRVVFIHSPGSLDPEDPDPADGSHYDLYSRAADGAVEWLSRGSLQPAVGGESPNLHAVSSDGSVVVFSTDRVLEPGAAVPSIYARGVDSTTIVSIAPNGTALRAGTGSRAFASHDGSRIYFEARVGFGPERVYLREGDTTVEVSASNKPVPDPQQDVRLESASDAGDTAVISTTEQLLPADTDASRDIYVWDRGTQSLSLISKGSHGGDSDDCDSTYGVELCEARFVVASLDGSSVAFISPEALEPGATPDEANLYVHRDGVTRFIATLVPADLTQGTEQVGLLSPLPEYRPARITRNGGFLAFESGAEIPGFENGGHPQVYLVNVETGELRCASCPRDGSPPTAEARLKERTGSAQYTTAGRNVTEDGDLVFFETAADLVSKDVNGRVDVYEYDSVADSHRLISAGTGPSDSHYYDSSADGTDVFFLTTDTLVPHDRNGSTIKLYNARIGGGFPTPPGPPADCEGSECQGVPNPPPPADDPASVGYVGPGNPVNDGDRCGFLKREVARHRARASRLRRKARRAEGTRRVRLRMRATAARHNAKGVRRLLRECGRAGA